MPRANTTTVGILLLLAGAGQLQAQEIVTNPPKVARNSQRASAVRSDDSPREVLSSEEWQRVDKSVDQGLTFLATQQQPDGSFPSTPNGQPAVTSLCVLAFMSHGHNPGSGPYGERLERAIKYITDCQKPSGLIMLLGGDEPQINRNIEHEIGSPGTYDHAISSLTLCEIYGMNPTKNAPRLKTVIDNALRVTFQMQRWEKDSPDDEGGWRYINDYDRSDSDLSVTGWHLMFLRSARNAGFRVPEQSIADAVAFIRRTFSKTYGTFNYTINQGDVRTRGMTGAGILALGHAGFHNSIEARRAAEDLLGYSFEVYNGNGGFKRDRYHYSLFMCCQGMYQMGSPYWEQFYPRTVRAVLANQQPDGSWNAESFQRDRPFGNSYTTALVLLAVAAPNQLLPIFQR
jgi:Prenyltransferase and squalene oxidase repeat